LRPPLHLPTRSELWQIGNLPQRYRWHCGRRLRRILECRQTSICAIKAAGRHDVPEEEKYRQGNTPATTPSAPKPTAPSAEVVTNPGAAARTSPTPIAPYEAAVPGFLATHFAPWTVACGTVAVTNFPYFSTAVDKMPWVFVSAPILWIMDAEASPVALVPLFRERIEDRDTLILSSSKT
jgi:hypothetical protein